MPSGGDDSDRGNGRSGQSSTGNSSTDSSSPGRGGGWGGSRSGNANSPNAGGGRTSESTSSSTDSGRAGGVGSPGVGGGFSGGRESSPSSAGAGRGSFSGAESTGGIAPGFDTGRFGFGGPSEVSSVGGGRGTSPGSPTTGGYNPVSRSYQQMADSMLSQGVPSLAGSRMKSGMPKSMGLFSSFDPSTNGKQAGFTTEFYDPKKTDFATGMMAIEPSKPRTFTGLAPNWSTTKDVWDTPSVSGRPGQYGMVAGAPSYNHMGTFERISGPEGTRGAAGYSVGYGGVSVPGLTDMTLAEVLAYGPQHKTKYGSSALGKPQVMNHTLKDFIKARNIDVNTTKFNKKTQDDIVAWAMDRRVEQASKMPGGLTAENLGKAMAQEWAGLATSTGKSHYHDDGVNRAHNSWADTKAIAQAHIDGMNTPTGPASSVTAFNEDRTGLMNPDRAMMMADANEIGNSSSTEGLAPADTQAPDTSATASVSAPGQVGDVAIDESGKAAPKNPTAAEKVAAGVVDVAVTTLGGLPGAVVQVAAKAILGKSVGEVIVDSMGNRFTLNGDGSLTPIDDADRLGGDSQSSWRDDEAFQREQEALKNEDEEQATEPVTDPVARVGVVYLGHPLDKYIAPRGLLYRRGSLIVQTA